MVTKFGAFYDSTLDRVGRRRHLHRHRRLSLDRPRRGLSDRRPSIACMVAILSSLLVSYARARAEGLGLDCKVGIAQRAERILLARACRSLAGGARARTRCVLEGVVALLAVASHHHRGAAVRVRLPARRRRAGAVPRAGRAESARSILSRKDVSSG